MQDNQLKHQEKLSIKLKFELETADFRKNDFLNDLAETKPAKEKASKG